MLKNVKKYRGSKIREIAGVGGVEFASLTDSRRGRGGAEIAEEKTTGIHRGKARGYIDLRWDIYSIKIIDVTENELSGMVVDICLKIHKKYGPGLLESVYESIFCYEWDKTGILFTRQQGIPLFHEGIKLDVGFRSDVIVDNKLLIDFKSLESIPPVHFKRVITYLKLSKLKLGLVLNFDVALFKDGIFRIVNGL